MEPEAEQEAKASLFAEQCHVDLAYTAKDCHIDWQLAKGTIMVKTMESKAAKIETIKDLIEFLKQFPVDSKVSVSYINYGNETDSSAYEDYMEIGGAKYYEYDNSVVLW